MRGLLLAASLALAFLAGCGQRVDEPGSALTVDGRLVDAQATPRAGQPVRLFRSGTAALGQACEPSQVGSALLLDTSPVRAMGADAEGRFHFELQSEELQAASGEALCFALVTDADAQGRQVYASFPIQQEDVAVPELALWDSRLQIGSSNGALALSWKSARDAVGATDGETLRVTTDDGVLWSASFASDTSALGVPLYLLEDFQASAELTAQSTAQQNGQIFRITHGAGSVALPAAGLTPASRGAACSAPGIRLPTPCPFTDGLLAQSSAPASLTLTLKSAALARRIVLRNVDSGHHFSVEASPDGQVFTPVSPAVATEGGFVDAPLDTAAPMTTYRITFDSGAPGTVVRVGEISLVP